MKPVKILCENFKGLDFTHDLKLVNMFTGPNESGKTARLRAVAVALLGYDPEIGKQPSSTIGFASDRRMDMTVHMEFDNALFITRTFKRNAKGEVSRINKGMIPDVPAIIFDYEEYLGDKKTTKDRIQMVFDRIDVSQIALKDEDLIANLSKIEALPAAESVKAVVEMIETVKKAITRRTSLKATIQSWLEELVNTLAGEAKAQKGLQDGKSKEMTLLRPQGKTPESVEAKLKEVREKIAALEKKEAEFAAQRTAYQKNDTRRNYLKNLLAQPPADMSQFESKKAALEKELSDNPSNTAELRKSLAALTTEYNRLDAGIKKMEADIAALESRKKDLEGKVKCPFCKSSKQGWKDEYAAELDTQINDIRTKIAENAIQRATVADEGRKTKADLAAAETADQRIAQKYTELRLINEQIACAQKQATERAAAEGELKGLESATLPDEKAVAAVNEEKTKLQTEEAALISAQAAYDQFVRNKSAFEVTEKKLIEHQVRVEVYKQAAALVVAEQKAIVAKAFDSILEPARRFTDGIIGGRLDYQNDELGITTDNGWVGHKFMAGRGKDLAYLGLQVALAQQSPIKVILLDEFGDFDKTTKIQVIDRLLTLTREGFIDSAFCADPDGEIYLSVKDPDFQHVKL